MFDWICIVLKKTIFRSFCPKFCYNIDPFFNIILSPISGCYNELENLNTNLSLSKSSIFPVYLAFSMDNLSS